MIVSIVNLKGGVGKTTTAVALATAARRDGKAARLYDADPQSSASLWAAVAEDNGDPLPFEVLPANVATIRPVGRRLKGDAGEWAVIDCPPNGRVVDEAVKAADLVIVPTTTGPADMVKTFETAETLSCRGVRHAILMTRTVARTVALRQSMAELEERGVGRFDARIPSREALKGFFGNAFGDDLFGYEAVYREVKEGLEDGD